MTLSKGIFSTILCVSALALASPDARAGFDWTPSPSQKAGMHSHKVTPQSPEADAAGPLTPEPDAPPVPVEDVQSQNLPEGDSPAAPAVMKEETLPVPLATEQPQEQAQTGVAPAPTTDVPVIEGFGTDISLALALRDIVPSGYAYAFKNPADAGLKVSWRGGKIWQDVLTDTLAPHELAYSVVDTAVYIYPAPKAAELPAQEQAATPFEPAAVMATPQEIPVPVVVEAPAPAPAVEMVPAEVSQTPVVADQPAEVPVIKATMNKNWVARPGSTLREVIESWSKTAGVEVQWMSPYDYPINNAFNFDGTFDKAVASLLSQYSRETPRPRGRLYPNLPAGPSVLMIN